MNINIPSKPTHTTQSAEITVVLDREYKLLLRKFVNGEIKYEAELLEADVSDEVREVVIKTAVNYCQREGIWG